MNIKLPKTSNTLKKYVISLAIALPAILVISHLAHGHLIYWYDNARDLQTAWNNLQKPTLIGPTSGIHGIFYGPYWIWLLSLGQLFSKNPLVIAFVAASLPYLIILPFIWFKFSKYLHWQALVIGWILFMLGNGMTYATQLWNPYPAPLLTVGIIYMLLTLNILSTERKYLLQFALLGALLGLLINFHISFGIAILFGCVIFLLYSFAFTVLSNNGKRKTLLTKHVIQLFSVGLGFLIIFIPTLLFEIRHGFNQFYTLLNTFSHYGDVVAVKGLSKPEILQQFGETLGQALSMPMDIALLLLAILLTIFLVLLIRKQFTFYDNDKRFSAILISLFGGVAFIYLTAKNPVWEYHFIGVDLLFIFLITFLLSKLKYVRLGIGIWVIYLVVSFVPSSLIQDSSVPSYFIRQQNIVHIIANDAGIKPYAVATYTNATYSHENTYLFRWLKNKDVPSDPNLTPNENIIYLVIPNNYDAKIEDFINYRTPEKKFKTEKTWDTEINSKILKRVKQ